MQERQREHELMDDPTLDRVEHAHALAGLARLNTLSGAAHVLWKTISAIARKEKLDKMRVLDIATGSADVPLSLWKLGRDNGLDLQVDGCDISETAISVAYKNAAKIGSPSQFFKVDAADDRFPEGYDIIMNNLFMHHLSDEESIAVLSKMAASTRRYVVISDLERSVSTLAMVQVACHLVSSSHVVHFDGPASVRSAYNIDELRQLAEVAGLHNATIEPKFPCRMLLTWRKPVGS